MFIILNYLQFGKKGIRNRTIDINDLQIAT